MKLLKTILKFTFGGAFLLVVVFVGWNWGRFSAFPSIISSFSAKTVCSCMFVAGNPEKYCRNNARQYVPIQSTTIDLKNKSVTIKGLWRTNTAKYRNKRLGCRLTPLDKGKP